MGQNFGPLWDSFVRDIRKRRTRKPVLDTKAMDALKARAIVTTPDAELDYSAYLSEQFLNNRKTK
jgi:hypothetical protein